MKKKLSLDEIKVSSFTLNKRETIQGGASFPNNCYCDHYTCILIGCTGGTCV